jgi:hypothetical protein
MSAFPKTRAAARYAARHAWGELARARAAVVLARLGACEGIPAGGEVPAVFHGLLRDLVLAVRDLAGPAWLDASGDDPDVAAFTALQATPVPPSPAELDEIIARVLWARFAPPGPPRDGAGPAPGPAAGHDMAARSMCRPPRTAGDPRPGTPRTAPARRPALAPASGPGQAAGDRGDAVRTRR